MTSADAKEYSLSDTANLSPAINSATPSGVPVKIISPGYKVKC
jgi:hypothetical protein